MGDNFTCLFLGDLAVFSASILMELLLIPRPRFSRPLFAWLCQFGIFTCLYSLFILLLGRPICSAGLVLAVYLILILVNNAKYKSLREPFLYQDYDYFLDVFRFPRLFLPFLGIKNFAFCVLGCLIALAAMLIENPPPHRFSLNGQAGMALIIFAIGLISLVAGTFLRSSPVYDTVSDFKLLGYPAFLYLYGLENRNAIQNQSSFPAIFSDKKFLPNLIAIQSESFFDPRSLDGELSPDILKNLDLIQKQSFLHGFLEVPAWGANTVRTEFSFLTGIELKNLGPHQFNPYRAMLGGWIPESLPARLKAIGYETLCLHPWYAEFYGRKNLFPAMGFNKFADIREFYDCPKSGAYTDDRCLADKLLSFLAESKKPVFIFAITMENHGPLQDDIKARERMSQSAFRKSWPAECYELPVYIDHLVHTDLMIDRLYSALSHQEYPVSLCFYGDHVPIMPCSYQILGYPKGDTPYFCWSNYNMQFNKAANIPVWRLAQAWLNGSGFS